MDARSFLRKAGLALAITGLCAIGRTGPALAQDSPEAYAKVWVVPTKDWNNGIVLTPWGDVLAMSARKLRVMAQDTGQVLEVVATSYAIENALAFTGPATCIVVCAGGVEEITFPGGAVKVAVRFPDRAEAAAACPAAVATANESGHVRVYSTKDWAILEEFEAGSPLEGLALSASGDKLAYGCKDGRIVLRDLKAKKMAALREADYTSGNAIAFSTDGSRLFATLGSFKAALFDTIKATRVEEYRMGSWLTSAAVLPPGFIAAAGADGLVLYTKGGEPARRLKYSADPSESAATGLAATPDGKALFVGNRDGEIACFASRPLKPSTYAGAKTAQGGQAAPDTPANELEVKGVLLAREGSRVTIKAEGSVLLAVGGEGILSKYFETKIASFTTTGWMEIAAVRVTKISGQKVDLQILEKKSVVTVNGQEVDHFKEGVQIKLVIRRTA